jgi:hypothetical protein
MAKAKKSSRLHEPTAFSKFLAMALFVLLPLFFFWFGMHFQKAIDEVRYQGSLYEIPQDVLRAPTGIPSQPRF